jgi:O-methyltransferase
LTDVARRFWSEAGVADRIELRLGDAAQTMDDLLSAHGEGAFDMILIDADKPSYPVYYDKAFRLVRPGGIIVLDDTLIRGRVVSGPLAGDPPYYVESFNAVAPLNARLHAASDIEMVLLPWRDGLTIVQKRAKPL